MEGLKVKKYGPLCGKQGSCLFYKAFKYSKDGTSKVIGLGQFFFMKILRDVPICIGELQLVWEEKTTSQDLVSVRLYFLPECTPDGRQTLHGEDEVLAYSEKIVLKLDDLAGLLVHNVSWSEGRRAFTESKLLPHTEHEDLGDSFKLNSFGLDTSDIQSESKDQENTEDSTPEVVIMSFARYCRYRSILKRLENCEDKWLRHAIVTAIGGFTSKSENNRIYFCRDTFEHPDLDDFELRCDHLAPTMKGKLKKAKDLVKKESVKEGTTEGAAEGATERVNDTSEDSSSSSSVSSQNENNTNNVRTGARATPLRNGFRIDKTNVSKDEQAFLIELHKFMKSRNTPIGRIPSLGFKQIDLYQFYSLAEEIGGYEQITAKRLWKNIYDALGGSPGSTSAATYTRRHYEKLLLPYERYRRMQRGMKGHATKEKKYHSTHSHVVKSAQLSTKVKEESKVKVEKKREEPNHINGDKGHGNTNKENINMKEKTLIIRQEIEKMKMRKDAQKQKDSVSPESDKEKIWENRRKMKIGDKIRKPSGGQKTVRELLDQNGKELDSQEDNGPSSKIPQDRKPEVIHNKDRQNHIENQVKSEKNNLHFPRDIKTSFPSSSSETKFHTQPQITPLSPPRPMLYPQFIPMSPHFRGIAPIPMPFMLPQFGIQPLGNPAMHHTLMNPSVKEVKPETSFNSMLSDVKNSMEKSAIYSNNSKLNKPSSSSLPCVPPPSNHTQPPRGPLTSPDANESKKRPIIPAHSNSVKRQYPYSDSDRNLPGYSDKKHDVSKNSDIDLKRQKMIGSSDSSVNQSNSSGQFEMPVLDLSMKTLRAQEERQQRGESLLFNASFSKDAKPSPKSGLFETPQDLSVKSQLSKMSDLSTSLALSASHRSIPLNVPHPRSTLDVKSPISTKPENHRREGLDLKIEKSEPSFKLPQQPGALPSIGGLPVDMGLVHPAFPFLPGVFPTPLQLQQMIQGQVAAGGMPGLFRPEMMHSPMMFPHGFAAVPPNFFTSVAQTIAKTSTSTSLTKR